MLALNRKCEVDGKMTKRINVMADSMVQQAIEGNAALAREILDRVEGKVASTMEYSGKTTHELSASDSFIKLLDAMNRPSDQAKVIEGKVIED